MRKRIAKSLRALAQRLDLQVVALDLSDTYHVSVDTEPGKVTITALGVTTGDGDGGGSFTGWDYRRPVRLIMTVIELNLSATTKRLPAPEGEGAVLVAC